MARLIYSAMTSLDGYTEDRDGKFAWARPDAEVHTFVNDLERSAGTYLYGRRMYETMLYWETADTLGDQSPIALDYARVWKDADKIVFSRTIDEPSTARTRIEREFDPAAVGELKAAATADITVGGPELAGHALAAGLVDEIHLFAFPVILGGGKPAMPDGIRLDLSLIEERRFGNGVIYLRYATTRD